MKCPYGTQRWNHFWKAATKPNQKISINYISFDLLKKKEDNSDLGFILINDLC